MTDRSFRAIGRPVGTVVIGLGVAIGLCAAASALWDTVAPRHAGPTGGIAALLVAAAVATIAGIAVYAWGRNADATMTRREAVLAVTVIWLAAGTCGGLPFMFGAGLSPTDALFESISGLTTTGATVITDIEGRLPRSLLLWRSLIQWLGGMGIVVLFVAVFPSLGAGGKHLFRGEVPGTTPEGLKPRIAETSFALWKLYALLTALETAILFGLGMSAFEAVCHAFTTMSTGGFSTRDASIAAFENPSIEYAVSLFMLLGSVNYGLYYAAIQGRSLRVIVRSIEFRAFVSIVVLAVASLTLLNLGLHGSLLQSFRFAFFMVSTTISSTGYGTDDYSAYPATGFAIVIALMFLGGCSGSTAGGIKVERVVLMAKQTIAQIKKNYTPSVVQVVRIGRAAVSSDVLADVMAFLAIYLSCLAAGVLVVCSVEGTSVPTAFGAMLTCLSNMGPAPFHVDADNFANYSAVSKTFFALAMLLGRLEFFTMFALIIPGFWKR